MGVTERSGTGRVYVCVCERERWDMCVSGPENWAPDKSTSPDFLDFCFCRFGLFLLMMKVKSQAFPGAPWCQELIQSLTYEVCVIYVCGFWETILIRLLHMDYTTAAWTQTDYNNSQKQYGAVQTLGINQAFMLWPPYCGRSIHLHIFQFTKPIYKSGGEHKGPSLGPRRPAAHTRMYSIFTQTQTAAGAREPHWSDGGTLSEAGADYSRLQRRCLSATASAPAWRRQRGREG